MENMGAAFLTPPVPSADGVLARAWGNSLTTASALEALRPGSGVMLKLLMLNGAALFSMFLSSVLEVGRPPIPSR